MEERDDENDSRIRKNEMRMKDLVIRKDSSDGDDGTEHDAQVEVIIRGLLIG